jgi:hypothetical protein
VEQESEVNFFDDEGHIDNGEDFEIETLPVACVEFALLAGLDVPQAYDYVAKQSTSPEYHEVSSDEVTVKQPKSDAEICEVFGAKSDSQKGHAGGSSMNWSANRLHPQRRLSGKLNLILLPWTRESPVLSPARKCVQSLKVVMFVVDA